VIAKPDIENVASQRVLEKSGFRIEAQGVALIRWRRIFQTPSHDARYLYESVTSRDSRTISVKPTKGFHPVA